MEKIKGIREWGHAFIGDAPRQEVYLEGLTSKGLIELHEGYTKAVRGLR